MVLFRRWIWRVAMGAGGLCCLFFAVMAVAPFETVGEPVFDTVVMRARYWQGSGVALLQLIGVAAWVLTSATAGQWPRTIKAAAAALALFACFIAMANEYNALIQYGDLRDVVEVARHKLMMSRGITLALAAVSLGAGWWARVRR